MPLCLSCLSSMSEHGCTFPLISPNFCVREPFSSLYDVQKFLLLSLALRDALPIVPSSLPSGCSCKHTSASFKCEKMFFSAYLFNVSGEAAQFSELGEHIKAPPCIPQGCIYIPLSRYNSVWGTYVPTLMFEWMGASTLPSPRCVVMFFNGDSLCTFSRVCAFLLLLIPAPRGAILAGGPCWRTNM